MSRVRVSRAFSWAATLLAAITVTLAFAPTSQAGAAAANQATEVGVTPTAIHIAVVADVNNAVVPGLFAGSERGVKAWAAQVNKQGGLAGRKVVVDFIDSQLSASQARAAVIQACSNDYAMVGTSVLFLSSPSDLLSCKDQSGKTTGLPNLAAVATNYSVDCSPVTYLLGGNSIDCSTVSNATPTFHEPLGPVPYFTKKYGKLKADFLVSADTPGAEASEIPSDAAWGLAGNVDVNHQYPLVSASPQSAYTPIVGQFRAQGINTVWSGMEFNALASAEKEAALQGANSNIKVWGCATQCYTPQFLSEGGSAINGTYVELASLPYTETSSNKDLSYLVHEIGLKKIDSWAVEGYVAGVMFQDAVQAIVKKSGNNGLTRAALLQAMPTLTNFNANGLWETENIGAKQPSGCYILTQVKNGKFVRVYPTKPGTFACSKLVTIKINPNSGGN